MDAETFGLQLFDKYAMVTEEGSMEGTGVALVIVFSLLFCGYVIFMLKNQITGSAISVIGACLFIGLVSSIVVLVQAQAGYMSSESEVTMYHCVSHEVEVECPGNMNTLMIDIDGDAEIAVENVMAQQILLMGGEAEKKEAGDDPPTVQPGGGPISAHGLEVPSMEEDLFECNNQSLAPDCGAISLVTFKNSIDSSGIEARKLYARTTRKPHTP